mmetsp:Transcript_8576/g.20450  ORF Transcript_8576/g.20450 Transcript_8576/m.20450 type:complete len:257 (-) Transcript_8576:1613-2383(-)
MLVEERLQPLHDHVRRNLCRVAVDVRPRRRRRRHSVRTLVRGSIRNVHRGQGDIKAGRDHLGDLRVQTLPHLDAAVRHKTCPVLVHVHQRAALVQLGGGERDTEHGRHGGDSSLFVPVPLVEHCDRGLPGLEIGLPHEIRPQLRQWARAHLLAEEGLLVGLVQIRGDQFLAGDPELSSRMLIHDLAHKHPLRAAKPPEGRVRRRVGLGHLPPYSDTGHVAPVEHVEHRSVHHGLRQIVGVPGIQGQVHINCEQPSR